jgi:hypothetical protein
VVVVVVLVTVVVVTVVVVTEPSKAPVAARADRANHAALIGCLAGEAAAARCGRVAGVDRRAAHDEALRKGGPAVVREGCQERIGTRHVGARQAAAPVAVDVVVVPDRREAASRERRAGPRALAASPRQSTTALPIRSCPRFIIVPRASGLMAPTRLR